jgi:hypothetical protein
MRGSSSKGKPLQDARPASTTTNDLVARKNRNSWSVDAAAD